MRYKTESVSSNDLGKSIHSVKDDSEEEDDNDEDDDEEDYEDESSSSDKAIATKSKGVKSFFKNLINFTKFSDKRKNNANDSKTKNEKINIVKTVVIVEKTDLKHRFLTVKNKNLDLFNDYRNNHAIKTLDEFRLFLILKFKIKLQFNCI